MMSGQWKTPPEAAKGCTFCACQVKIPIPMAFSVCNCPCHWRTSPVKENLLSAVRHFFGADLGVEGERQRAEGLVRGFRGTVSSDEAVKVLTQLLQAIEEGRVAKGK